MLDKVMKDVMDFDKHHGLMEENEPNLENLFYITMCLVGESGEIANEAKKIWRDGDSEELREKLATEVVDILIYIAKTIKILEIDIEEYWDEKHEELYERWKDKEISTREVDLSK